MLFLILTADETDKVKALFHKYSGKLLSHIKKIVKDEDLADDALQETFIRVMKNIDKIEDANPGKTKNYLYTIANNSALHFYNQIKKYNSGEGGEVLIAGRYTSYKTMSDGLLVLAWLQSDQIMRIKATFEIDEVVRIAESLSFIL